MKKFRSFFEEEKNKVIVYRGVREMGEKRFDGEHFSTLESFASIFGKVSKYELELKNVLDLSNYNNIKKNFGEEFLEFFKTGDFWKSQTDKYGFSFHPLKTIINFAKKIIIK